MNGVSRFLSKRKGKGSGDGKVSATANPTSYDLVMFVAALGAAASAKEPTSTRLKLLFAPVPSSWPKTYLVHG